MSAGGSKLRKLDAISSTAVQLEFHCVWPVLFAVAIGATLFGLTHGDLLPAMFDNKLSEQQRLVGLGYFGVALLLVGAFYGAVLGYRYRALGPFGFEQARRLHPYLSFLLSGPFIVALTPEAREQYDSLLDFISQIEPDASVSVSNRLGAHVSNRLEVRRIRQRIDTDYILVDSRDLRGAIKSTIDKHEEAGKIELLERRGSWTLYQAASPVEIE